MKGFRLAWRSDLRTALRSFPALPTATRSIMQNPALDLCDTCGSGDTLQNSYNLFAQRAQSDNNVPLRFVFSGLWNLPFGSGQAWANSGVRQQDCGWLVTGRHLPGAERTAVYARAFVRQRERRNGLVSEPGLQRHAEFAYDPALVRYQLLRHAGFLPIRQLRAEHSARAREWITSISPFTAILRFPGKGSTLQFRVEAFNALNHPQFGQPGATLALPTTGVISSTSTPNRILQFALRYAF